jgi:anti-anti-sigma regulatory factor
MFWEQWIAPRSTDEHTARRERLVNILALGGASAGMVFLLVVLVLFLIPGQQAPLASAGGGVACVVLALSCYGFSRSGWVRQSAILIVLSTALLGFYAVYMRGTLTASAVMLTLAPLFAGAAISGPAGAITALIEFVLYILMAVAEYQGWINVPDVGLSPITGITLVGISLGFISLITWQTVRSLENSLRQAQEREESLETVGSEKDDLLAELQAREDAQRHLVETVRNLGSPVIPLAEGVIAMPLIGAIDSGRAQHVTEALLQGVSAHRATVAIVDITGVPLVDTAVAGALIEAMAGVRLLGAEAVLTGIRAEVAQTMVTLGLDLGSITTRATLQEGLEYAIS